MPQVIGLAAADQDWVYLHRTDTRELLALDSRDGSTVWSRSLPLAEVGVRQLLADDSTLYALTPTQVTAYEAANGAHLWSARLGDGHVSILMDNWATELAVYYGDILFEVDKETGGISGQRALADVLWIVPPIEVHWTEGEMYGLEGPTGVVLWRSQVRQFWTTEKQPPVGVDESSTLVFVDEEGPCLFDAGVGEYRWCYEGGIVSNTAVDSARIRAFALTENLELVSLDLADGEPNRLASFSRTRPLDPNLAYEFAIATVSGRVYAYFADTGQLFALEVD